MYDSIFFSIVAKDLCSFGLNGNCSHICSTIDGSQMCFCPLGYTLMKDNKTCVGKKFVSINSMLNSSLSMMVAVKGHCKSPIAFENP